MTCFVLLVMGLGFRFRCFVLLVMGLGLRFRCFVLLVMGLGLRFRVFFSLRSSHCVFCIFKCAFLLGF
jgi:hypothetical protein